MGFSTKLLGFLLLSLAYACSDFDSSSLDHDQIQVGEQGAVGETGATGPTGQTGAQGPSGNYTVLVDQNDKEIGYYLDRVDFTDNTFEIMTVEGFRTVIDLDDGSFKPPQQMGGAGVSCMYESNDCTGSCFGVDELARGYLLNSTDGQIFSVASQAASQSITFNSYNESSALAICKILTGALPTAVNADIYQGILSETLLAPLYFKIVNPAGE